MEGEKNLGGKYSPKRSKIIHGFVLVKQESNISRKKICAEFEENPFIVGTTSAWIPQNVF